MDAKIKNPQDALEWLDRSIRDEAELAGEMSNEHAIQIAFIQNMLAKFPRRNCDVGTPEEQAKRKMEFCYKQGGCANCSFCKSASLTQCAFEWAQMPYVEKEGGAKLNIEIDEVDFGFITSVLCRAKVVFELLGSSHGVGAVNRDRYREDAKMAQQAREMMYAAKEGGKE